MRFLFVSVANNQQPPQQIVYFLSLQSNINQLNVTVRQNYSGWTPGLIIKKLV